MGFFIDLVGDFECVRCRRTSTASIQTKLLRHQADNSCRDYRVGDTEALVGLDDYCPLDPWDGRPPLVVAVGDWDCGLCRLSGQWAKAVFDLSSAGGGLSVTLRELVGLQPWRPSDLAGVHYAEPGLAELSGLWAPPPGQSWPEGFWRWQASPLAERRARVVAGFRRWYREVAGVGNEAEPGSAADGGGR